eukprot:6723367-Prymnesium_polylepis.1
MCRGRQGGSGEPLGGSGDVPSGRYGPLTASCPGWTTSALELNAVRELVEAVRRVADAANWLHPDDAVVLVETDELVAPVDEARARSGGTVLGNDASHAGVGVDVGRRGEHIAELLDEVACGDRVGNCVGKRVEFRLARRE